MGCGGSKPETGNNAVQKASTDNSKKSIGSTKSKKNENNKHIDECYKMGDVLGEGGYSVVKLGVDIETEEKVAIKIITRKGLLAEDEESLHSEVKILRSLNHPNITKCYNFFTEVKYYYVVLEYLDGGELFDRIVAKTVYNEKEARDLVELLLLTLKDLHDKNIVHRDLKPENLLLKSKDKDTGVKLADFGFAVECNGDNITSQCGTPGYIAPEILQKIPYGKSVDMWSFGVILFILLGGYPPFHDDNQRNLFKKIMKGEFQFHPDFWEPVSEEAKDLISKLLTVDVKKRLTVDDALTHPWLLKDKSVLESNHIDLAELRRYQATKKLKKSVRAVMAVGKMKKLLGATKAAAQECAAEEAREPQKT